MWIFQAKIRKLVAIIMNNTGVIGSDVNIYWVYYYYF